MGLDVVHFKLSHKYQHAYSWDEAELRNYCNVPFHLIEHYLTDIPNSTAVPVFYILIFENESDRTIFHKTDNSYLRACSNSDNYFSVINPKLLLDQASSIQYLELSDKNLKPFEMNIDLTKEDCADFKGKMKMILFFNIHELEKGFFLEEIGAMNKTMGNSFYKWFDDGKTTLFGQKEDFEFAHKCVAEGCDVDMDWTQEEIEDYRNDFKKSFLDNFEYGSSLM